MKAWLTKWRISNALDERKTASPPVARELARSAELRRFAENAAAVDQALKNTRPATAAAPPWLHEGILRAVRSAEAGSASGWQKYRSRFIPAGALGLVILLGVIGDRSLFRSPSTVAPAAGRSPLAIVSSTLETGSELMQAAPSAALSPLSDEMARLNHDLTNAQNYLLASLP